MAKKRSVGVTVFGILLILCPLFYYLQGVIIFLIKSIPLTSLPSHIIRAYRSNPFVPLLQLAFIICGIGVLQLKEWARNLIVSILAIGLLFSILFFVVLASSPLIKKLSNIIFDGLFLWFFTRPKVKEQFKQ